MDVVQVDLTRRGRSCGRGDGYLAIPDAPGLGIDLDEEAVRRPRIL